MEWYKITRWFWKGWWEYLLERPVTWTKFWCRATVHKCGPIWFSWGNEPNYRCKNCGDYLG